MPIQTVLLDLDGTLLDRRATFRRHLERQIARHPDVFAVGDAESYATRLLKLDENGTLDRYEFYRTAEERFSLPSGASRRLQADFEERFPEECVPLPGLMETLEALKSAGLRLGLITNGRVLIQTRKIDGLGIRPYLDCVLISEAVGVRKPDPRIFEAALRELGTERETAAYVGDNPAADMVGARRSGLVAIWRRDDFWPEPEDVDAIIDHLPELPEVIAGWPVPKVPS